MAATTLDLATLKTNNSWATGERLTETKLDNIFGITGTTGIQDWADDTVDNLNQLRLDCFGSSYTLDNDATANFSSATLFNKQVATDSYSTNINLGTSTDADWTDVDATNASITFTPDTLTGDFKATFVFTDHVVGSGQADCDCETIYRLTDSTTNSNPVKVQQALEATGLDAGDNMELCIPVTLVHVFTGLTASSKTIKLQKKVLTASNVATHDTDGSSNNVMYMIAEKI